MTIRTVTGHILNLHGAARTGDTVTFRLVTQGLYTATEHVPRDTVSTTIDGSGNISISLYCPATYTCCISGDMYFDFVLPDSTSATTLEVLHASSTPAPDATNALQILIDVEAATRAAADATLQAEIDALPAGITLGSALPLINGTAAAGNAAAASHENHVHPTDTTRAPLASPALTGTPTAPTAATATNTTQLATTAFVQANMALAQPLDSDLTAIAALSTTSFGRALLALADAAALRTAAGLGSLATLSSVTASLISDASANGRSLITAADYAAMRTLLGLVIGTDVQAYDAELAALAGLTSAADKVPYFTGSGTAALATQTSFIRTLLDDVDAATARATLGADNASNLTSGTVAAARGGSIAEGRLVYGGTTGYSIPGIDGSVSASPGMVDSRIYYEPVIVRTQITIDQLAMEITTVGGATKVCRLGIYNADTSWQPTSLVLDAGTVLIDSLGVKTISISQTLAPGRYLFARVSNDTYNARAIRGGAFLQGYHGTISANPLWTNLYVASSYATGLPSTGVAYSTGDQGTSPLAHCIFCRISTP